MKKTICLATWMMLMMLGVGCATAPETESDRQLLIRQSESMLKQMQAEDITLERFISRSYGYAIFPHVGKGGFGVGGAYGRGVVYEKGQMIGYSDLTQATVGLQAGGQSQAELIVFESRIDLNRFTAGKFAFAANLSAVLLKTGAGDTAKYTDGVAIFIKPIAGAMFEAALGGQQFTYTPR